MTSGRINCSDCDTAYLLYPDADLKPKRTVLSKFILFIFIFVFPVVSLAILFISNLFLLEQSVWVQCFWTFNRLNEYEERFGPFVRQYYVEGCGDDRKVLNFQNRSSNLVLPSPPVPGKDACAKITDNLKFECYPRGNVSEESCNARGCCFVESTDPLVPSCFYPSDFQQYRFTNIVESKYGLTANLTAQYASPYPNQVQNLTMIVTFWTAQGIQVTIKDPNKVDSYYFLPEQKIKEDELNNTLYQIDINQNVTGFKILRKSNNEVLFNTQNIGGLIYCDQFIQLSAVLPTKYLYGIGERRGNVLINTEWNTITLFSHDTVPTDKVNGYGVHPFYLGLEKDGQSHGVTFLNTHAMDIIVQPAPAITYRAIGGELSFYFTLGPDPVSVVRSHTAATIGPPTFPPYWALGFHLCRLGYKTLDQMKDIWNKTIAAGIPFDTQWGDFDYMHNRNDFTVDPVNYKDLKKFVQHLHSVGMHFIPLTDPGVSGSEPRGTYPPYDQGIKKGIFIMDSTGKKPYIGKVWNPKTTVFVDFTHPWAAHYWTDQLKQFHNQVPFDGLWIDMNEPSNFMNGSECVKNPLDDPPYVPRIQGNRLCYNSVCMNAKHFYDFHYNVHSIYGTHEAIVSSLAMVELTGKRPFVISRSTTLATPRFAGHWTGDVFSTWDDMRQSVKDLISFSMFGQPLVGADICGFNGNTTATLCSRWSQLGAFYPFSRNHNEDSTVAQDPVSLGSDVVESAKQSLLTRYSLLPYFYTQFYLANSLNFPVIRPLFFEFPKDNNTYTIEDEFMWGPAILIAPVLEEGMTYRKVYLSPGPWYDWYLGDRTLSEGKEYLTAAPSHTIPIFIRGGYVVPTQTPNTTTTASRKNPFSLRVALNATKGAFGELYWDEGDNMDGNTYNFIEFKVVNGTILESKAVVWQYETPMKLSNITIGYVEESVKNVTLNNTLPCKFTYLAAHYELKITDLNIDLKYPFNITWTK